MHGPGRSAGHRGNVSAQVILGLCAFFPQDKLKKGEISGSQMFTILWFTRVLVCLWQVAVCVSCVSQHTCSTHLVFRGSPDNKPTGVEPHSAGMRPFRQLPVRLEELGARGAFIQVNRCETEITPSEPKVQAPVRMARTWQVRHST